VTSTSLTMCQDAHRSLQKVKRCLFGVSDHQATHEDLAALRRQLDAQSCRRWNFDFGSGTPLTSLPLSTAAFGGARWVWTRLNESWDAAEDSSRQNIATAECQRTMITDTTHHGLKVSPSSPSPRRLLLDKPISTVKRRRMSLTLSTEVKTKVAKSEVKVASCRKSVGGLERRRLLRSPSLIGSPSRMFMITFF